MTDFSDKPDEMSMAQQNLNPSSSKKWKMIAGTIFVVLIIVVSLNVILPKINSNSGKWFSIHEIFCDVTPFFKYLPSKPWFMTSYASKFLFVFRFYKISKTNLGDLKKNCGNIFNAHIFELIFLTFILRSLNARGVL